MSYDSNWKFVENSVYWQLHKCCFSRWFILLVDWFGSVSCGHSCPSSESLVPLMFHLFLNSSINSLVCFCAWKNAAMDDHESPLNCKKNIKWFLSRIENFNSAVPYQIDLLAAHKVKIHQVRKSSFALFCHIMRSFNKQIIQLGNYFHF